MLFSANNVLVVGLDNRPTSGYSSKEGGGANHSEADANTDTIMLWRVGGGVSRKLSIPRDTLVDIPGLRDGEDQRRLGVRRARGDDQGDRAADRASRSTT